MQGGNVVSEGILAGNVFFRRARMKTRFSSFFSHRCQCVDKENKPIFGTALYHDGKDMNCRKTRERGKVPIRFLMLSKRFCRLFPSIRGNERTTLDGRRETTGTDQLYAMHKQRELRAIPTVRKLHVLCERPEWNHRWASSEQEQCQTIEML